MRRHFVTEIDVQLLPCLGHGSVEGVGEELDCRLHGHVTTTLEVLENFRVEIPRLCAADDATHFRVAILIRLQRNRLQNKA